MDKKMAGQIASFPMGRRGEKGFRVGRGKLLNIALEQVKKGEPFAFRLVFSKIKKLAHFSLFAK